MRIVFIAVYHFLLKVNRRSFNNTCNDIDLPNLVNLSLGASAICGQQDYGGNLILRSTA